MLITSQMLSCQQQKYESMKKNLTPRQAYEIVVKKAKKKGLSPSSYAQLRGVERFILSRWKIRDSGTIHLDVALKLEIARLC